MTIDALCLEHTTTMMANHTLHDLADLLINMPSGGFVLEIGVYHGMTTAFIGRMLDFLRRAELVLSIDPFERAEVEENNQKGLFNSYRETLNTHHQQDRCHLLIGKSQEVHSFIAPAVAFMMIDGSHVYDNVLADLTNYLPKLLPGGLALLHDYWAAYPGSMQAIDEYLSQHAEYEPTYKSGSVALRRVG